MLQSAYAVLLLIALALNQGDRRMLALTAVVGASVFIPVPRDTALQFYSFCICAEIAVGLVALGLRASASTLVAEICALLAISHVLGYYFNGYLPLSPYRVIIKLLEASQLVALVALSPHVAAMLRNRGST